MVARAWPLILHLGLLGPMIGACSQLLPHLRQLHGDTPSQHFFHRIWAKDLEPSYQTGNLPISILSPTIHKGMLFQGSLTGEMNAYSLENGRRLWRAQARESIASPATIWGKYLIYGDLSGRLYAHHLLTGHLIYSVDIGRPAEGRPVFFKGRGFIHTRNHFLVSFDAATGKVLWSFKRSVPYTTTTQGVSNPLVYRNRLIVGFADGYLVALSLEDGLLIWEKKMFSTGKFVDVDTTPKLHKNRLYVSSYGGKFSALNPLTGELTQRFDFTATTPPVFMGGKMFVGTVMGDLQVLTGKGQRIKRLSLGENRPGPITGLLPWKGQLVVGHTGGELVQIDPVKLAIGQRLHLGHSSSALYGDPSQRQGYLAVMGARNRLYVYR